MKKRAAVIAGGNPLTAEAGAQILRDGGNAVDAAVAAMLTSFVAEPLLTGFGAGGYMLLAGKDEKPIVLDFFIAAPGSGLNPEQRTPLEPVTISFGEAVQVYNIGPSSCGVYGTPMAVCEAARRYGTMPFASLAKSAINLAHNGIEVTPEQENVFRVLAPIIFSSTALRDIYTTHGNIPRSGDRIVDHGLGNALELLVDEGYEPFYTGEIGTKVSQWLLERGGQITPADFAIYEIVEREPFRVQFRNREILTMPPPNAGGPLLVHSLTQLDRLDHIPSVIDLVEILELTRAERTIEFLEGLFEPGFLESLVSSRWGSTTHISVMDHDGNACSVTTTLGEGSGQIPPNTGIHLNNIMGESDLSPFGFFRNAPGSRLPSMMAPTIVLSDGVPELVVGSAGADRIHSAILQVIINAIDHRMSANSAVEAPRLHFENGIIYVEPGIDDKTLEAANMTVARFKGKNIFFGGAQAVEYNRTTQVVSGAGDPRRGGAAVIVE